MTLSEDDDIAAYLQSKAWAAPFEDDDLKTGASLKSEITNILWETPQHQEWILTAQLSGRKSGELTVEVVIWDDGGVLQIETTCGCQQRTFCHHAAAVLLRVSQPHIFNTLRNTGSLSKTARDNSEEQTRDSDDEEMEELNRIRTTPRFRIQLFRPSVYPEITKTYLKQRCGDLRHPTLANVRVQYGDYVYPLLAQISNGETRATLDGNPVILERFPALERDAASQLSQLGLMSVSSEPVWLARVQSKRPDWLDDSYQYWFPDSSRIPTEECWMTLRHHGMKQLESYGWDVELDPDFGYDVTVCDPGEWELALTEQHTGWFQLSVGFTLKGKTFDLLPILSHLLKDRFLEETLDRPNNGTQYTVLPDGTTLELPIGRVREILNHLSTFIDPKFPSKTKLHTLDAIALNEHLETEITGTHSLTEYKKKLQSFDQEQSILPPEGLKATMRDYQLKGLQWMQSLRELGLNGILADDMGLGKTLQTLAHLLLEIDSNRTGGKPSLVVAPTSVTTNWVREAQKFSPHLRTLLLQGAQRHRYHCSIPHSDLVITSYALLHRDIETLSQHSFHLLILDEAQYIKNPSAKATKAAGELRAAHRLCLSGTPVENNLGEFWSLMQFLMPGLLGSKEQFNTNYRVPIEQRGDEDRRSALKSKVSPLILRRTKDAVAKELPPKTELIHRIELLTEQKDLYETIRATMDKKIRQAIAIRGIEGSQFFFLSALLKLRQICCHPALLEDSQLKEHSAKLQFCLELIETLMLEGRKVLLFSQFTTMLDLIAAELTDRRLKFCLLTGETKNRGELVDRFQTGTIPIFLISLKAGGTGLTLTAADTVIHYDPWWNPAVERQATDRAYRIGQTKPVFVHKLICQNTVEEKIHSLQQKKGDLADAILSDSANLKLTPESLKSLLSS